MEIPESQHQPPPASYPIARAVISPTHFTSLTLDGLDITTAVRHYFDWIEGVGTYSRRRSTRANQGIPSPLDRDAVLCGNAIHESRGCEISARRDSNHVLLRFIHRDDEKPEVCWYSVIRLRSQPGPVPSVTIEHATGRSIPPHLRLPPVAGAPGVLVQLCELQGVKPRSYDLIGRRVITIAPGDAERFVRYILLDKKRSHPYLIVSAQKGTGEFLAEPKVLAQRLATQAIVVALHQDATWEFADAFASSGFDRQLGSCFDGAVRVYHAGLDPAHNPREHYLWLPDRLHDYSPNATERLAGEVAERITWRALPPRFFSILDDWDRTESRARAEALLQRQHETYRVPDLQAQMQAQTSEVADLRAQLQTAQEERQIWEREASDYESEVNELRRLLEEAEQERDEAKQNSAATSSHLANLRIRPNGLTDEQRLGIRAALKAQLETVSDTLHVLDAVYADRVVILPSAWRSAQESRAFRKVDKAWELMLRLVENYWGAVQEGGDAVAKHVFPPTAYAARESESVEGRKEAKERRTFEYNGAPLTMWKHLKIGVKDSVAETFRLHFEFDAERRKIVIGHCGKHLDFK